jgi:hypothetical protein
MAGESRCWPGPVAAASPAGSAHRSQQRPAGDRQGGRERLEQLPEGGAPVGLAGEERAVDGGQREARQLVSGRAVRVVTEGQPDLGPEQLPCLAAVRSMTACTSPSSTAGGCAARTMSSGRKWGWGPRMRTVPPAPPPGARRAVPPAGSTGAGL